MQEKESIMVVWSELKIPSPGITGANSYLHGGIFNLHLSIIKDSYLLSRLGENLGKHCKVCKKIKSFTVCSFLRATAQAKRKKLCFLFHLDKN